MPQYNFNVVGEKSVDAFFSGVFDSDTSARDYASQLAASLQDSMPDVCDVSFICLLRDGEEIAQFFLSTTH